MSPNDAEMAEFFNNIDPSMFNPNEEQSTEELRDVAKTAVACILFRLVCSGEISGEECGVMLYAVTNGNTRAEVAERWAEFCREMLRFIRRPAEEEAGKSDDVLIEELNRNLTKALNGDK